MVVVLTNAERIHQYLVHAVGQLFPENAPALRLWRPGEIQPTEPPDLVILDDPFGTPGALALLENRKESTWALVRLRDARSALDNLDAYWRMIDYFPDRHLVILVDASQLLHAAESALEGPGKGSRKVWCTKSPSSPICTMRRILWSRLATRVRSRFQD
jgi:hypothetical protein